MPSGTPIPEAEWYYAMHGNDVVGGPFGPGKKNALRELRRLRERRIMDTLHMVPEKQMPANANWYPE